MSTREGGAIEALRRRYGFRTIDGFGSPQDADGRAVRKAAWSITRQISLTSVAIVVIVVCLGIGVTIVMSQPQELLQKAAQRGDKVYVDRDAVLAAFGVIGAATVLVAAVASWFIARNAVRPLGRALQLQRSFVADASHELRTPLAVLDARIQLLQRRLDEGHPDAGDLATLREDAATLIGIVDELLLAAGGRDDLDGGEASDAAEVVRGAVADLDLLAAPRGVRIALAAPAGLRVPMPPGSLRRCVVALVDNALQHSYDGSTMEVALTATARTVALTVADHGPGIHGIAPARVFDRFAHAEQEGDPRLPRRVGFGIGLSLVRDLAARAGGTVRVAQTSAAGTTIVLELPRLGEH